MHASPLLCCWPGLPRLWLRGDWRALALATGFGLLLNLLLLSQLLWTEVAHGTAGTLMWLGLAGTWLFSAIRSYRQLPELVTRRVVDDRGLFIQAQGEYLKGHWFEAESLLQKVLQNSHHDVDAHLLLATVYRRSGRFDDAHARLRLIEQFEAAEKWRWEIDAERRLLQEHSEKTRNGVEFTSSTAG